MPPRILLNSMLFDGMLGARLETNIAANNILLRRTNYAAPTMPGELKSLPLTAAIAIPPIPTTFFPGNVPASTLLGH